MCAVGRGGCASHRTSAAGATDAEEAVLAGSGGMPGIVEEGLESAAPRPATVEVAMAQTEGEGTRRKSSDVQEVAICQSNVTRRIIYMGSP